MKKKWYKGKVFVITGASGEIGSEVCRIFAPLGMRMYLLDLQNPALDKLVEEVKELGAEHAEAMMMDVTNREQVEAVMKSIGEKEQYIDILHNNAGIGGKISITNGGTFEQYRKIMSINVDGIWLVLQAAVPYIGRPKPSEKYPDRREGQLIFTSSAAGKLGIPYMVAYTASKYAVAGLSESLRLEYKVNNHKIHVITIYPAPVKTKFWDADPEYQEWIKKYEKSRFLAFPKPKDVAKVVLKASRGNKKEVFVPRYYRLITWVRGLAGKMLISIERSELKEK
ncbi:MAG: SDR family oxidoreductase [Candidatus Helarchaeota archaeon]|nr:SDR family oxidoreductase [Candidatus Helarchaeota archaeon]